ncbi:hypothetical protein Adu01nite_11380 [Paractinoplanes durhamensis]|uniref:Uncharacterized protein n=1 Tax=Paractinoplanes durhamensis TaxID=113563 RepID=A0ABQ3YQG9_9ACTN|nr:hypothetical protein Adu01nite_11380 [Actinoplanes durhamensis]
MSPKHENPRLVRVAIRAPPALLPVKGFFGPITFANRLLHVEKLAFGHAGSRSLVRR